MESRRRAPGGRLIALLATFAAFSSSASAQLPSASAADLGLGHRTVSAARGFSAVAANPAGLGMPRPFRSSWTILPVGAGSALGPVTFSDLAEYDGRQVPHSVREGWIRRIEARGGQEGRLAGSITAAALAHGRFGFQLSIGAEGSADLNPDAAELLLFGNVGRTGEERDFRLAGSRMDAHVVTTAALSWALPLDIEIGDAPGQSFSVGATVKYVHGHTLLLARDLGSFLSGEPLEVWLRFPVVQTATGQSVRGAGRGVALDVGAQWQAGPWKVGALAQNLVETFGWNIDHLEFRPGTALFQDSDGEADFDARPAVEAPSALLAQVQDFRFGTAFSSGAAYRFHDRLELMVQMDFRGRRRADRAPRIEGGLGLEWRFLDRVPLRAHASASSQGVRIGGGGSVRAGRTVQLSGATSFVSGGPRDLVFGMLGVSVEGP